MQPLGSFQSVSSRAGWGDLAGSVVVDFQKALDQFLPQSLLCDLSSHETRWQVLSQSGSWLKKMVRFHSRAPYSQEEACKGGTQEEASEIMRRWTGSHFPPCS